MEAGAVCLSDRKATHWKVHNIIMIISIYIALYHALPKALLHNTNAILFRKKNNSIWKWKTIHCVWTTIQRKKYVSYDNTKSTCNEWIHKMILNMGSRSLIIKLTDHGSDEETVLQDLLAILKRTLQTTKNVSLLLIVVSG